MNSHECMSQLLLSIRQECREIRRFPCPSILHIFEEQEHFGRRQTIWRKAILNGNGPNGVGMRAMTRRRGLIDS